MAISSLVNYLNFPIIEDDAYFANFCKDEEALVDESVANALKSLQKIARKKEKRPIGRPRNLVALLPPPEDVPCMMGLDLQGDDLFDCLEPLHVEYGSCSRALNDTFEYSQDPNDLGSCEEESESDEHVDNNEGGLDGKDKGIVEGVEGNAHGVGRKPKKGISHKKTRGDYIDWFHLHSWPHIEYALRQSHWRNRVVVTYL